jgi:hypothetical protein
LDEQVMRGYLSPIRLTHNYHFAGNRILPGVFLEIQLKDSNKQLLMTVRLPDPEANAWLRHKQELFALGFVPDQPLPPPEGEVIPAPRQDVPRVPIWDVAGPLSLRLQRVQQHLIPRDRGPVYRPTEWSLVLARSYCRYLCRKHGAASAEIIRHSRDTIPPTEFLTRERPAGFTDLVANYGDLR